MHRAFKDMESRCALLVAFHELLGIVCELLGEFIPEAVSHSSIVLGWWCGCLIRGSIDSSLFVFFFKERD